jgi:hypothetical protein
MDSFRGNRRELKQPPNHYGAYGRRGIRPKLPLPGDLIFLWKNVLQADLQLIEHRFQFVQCQMMFAALNPEKGLVGQADFFRKLGIRQKPPLPSQELCQLAIEVAIHATRLANAPSRMRDDFTLQSRRIVVKSRCQTMEKEMNGDAPCKALRLVPCRFPVESPAGFAVRGYFSARVGKTASFSPAWNCGPTLASEMLLGKRLSRVTSRTRAMKRISQSGTLRRCDSKLATESRLMFHPRSWSFVAKSAWDQPRLARHFRTCGPMRFIAGFVTDCDGNETAGTGCVHTHTKKACHRPRVRRSIPGTWKLLSQWQRSEGPFGIP